jgi:hypothetical protein
VHLLNPSPTHPPADFLFPWFLLLSTFLGVSRQGEFGKGSSKVHVENFRKQIDNKFIFSSICFVLPRVQVFLSDGSSKALQKTFYKHIVSKSFYKKIGEKNKNRFFSFFLRGSPPGAQGALNLFLTGLGVVGWFLEGKKSTRAGQFLCEIFILFLNSPHVEIPKNAIKIIEKKSVLDFGRFFGKNLSTRFVLLDVFCNVFELPSLSST